MLYHLVTDHRRALLAQAGMRGTGHGMQRVTNDTSSTPEPAPGAKTKLAGSVDGLDGALPDPEWNKDIRAYYDAVVEEPVPQEFVDLLAEIAKDISE